MKSFKQIIQLAKIRDLTGNIIIIYGQHDAYTEWCDVYIV